MKILSSIFAVSVCSLTLTIASAQEIKKQEMVAATPVKTDNPPNNPRGYLLGPGDEIEIKVLGEPQFDGRYTVDEDGKIAVPFVEKPVSAGCRSEREVRNEVALALAKYLKNPQISVRIAEKRSRPPAVIYGEVRSQQQVQMNRRVRLLELLSFSGGVTDKAGGTVQVFHTQQFMCPEPGDELEAQPSADGLNVPFQVYKLSEVIDGKNNANPVIRPGDIVIVQKAAPVYVIGEVRMLPPEGIAIPEGGLTLTEAVVRVGGLTREAKKKDVRIYRLKPGTKERETIAANLDSIKNKKQPDILLQPYDVVEVEKAPKSVGDFLTSLLTGGVSNLANILPTRVIY